ncbi:potassium-transporting ATPase subunit C [Rhodococcus sp. HNM0569]|uniref:potassium-transporting ATPase subunit C n=1 Tax=Rhodococcus sp. HNM0569 TaxID=2716340 RepID=UPI00146D9096|nr:potassium-transporting ATPase subunit C [Rhodococcus sp. HNM0569]NLU84862.1 potassium-transporting ATPase subunit C [Rhodococcus sp. HNM0569]
MSLVTLRRGLLAQLRPAVVVLAALTVVLGIGYPAVVWLAGRAVHEQSEGSALADANGCVIGSSLIGVDPQVEAGQPDPYFHTRVTGAAAADDAFAVSDPAAALPSNLGPSSDTLAKFVAQRRAAVAAREQVDPSLVPTDAVTGSGSGIDPHISPEYAQLQVARVAEVNGLSEQHVLDLVHRHTDGATAGFLGAARVNVPELNVALGLTAPTCQ